MGDNKGWFLIGAIIIMIYLAINMNPAGQKWMSSIIEGVTGAEPEEGKAPEPEKPKLIQHDGVTVTMGPAKKMFAPTTSVTSEYHRLILDGANGYVDKGLYGDGNTVALTPYDTVTVVYGENSSTYYASRVDITLPDSAAFSTAQAKTDRNGKNIEDRFRLYEMDAAATLNAKCFNEDNGQLNYGSGSGGINGNGGNESLSNNEQVNIDCSIQGTAEDGFSPFGRILSTAIYNSTAYDSITLKPTTSGWSYKEGVNTPKFRETVNITTGFTSVTYAWFKTGKRTDGYELSGMIENEKIEYTLGIDTDDASANDPTIGGGGDIHLYFDDEDWFRNTDTEKMEFGAEDNDDADVGSTTTKHLRFFAK